MQNLSELNGYSTIPVTFNDNRTPGVTFDRAAPQNQNINVFEGTSHLVPIGINITEVIQYDTANVKLKIDVSNLSGTTVTWATVPVDSTVVEVSSGVYQIDGINSEGIWQTVRQPSVNLPNTYFGTFVYTVTIIALGVEYSYTVTTNITEVEALTNPLEFVYTGGATETITNTPNVYDPGTSNVTWTVTVTPNITAAVTTLSSSGSATTSFNNTTKVYTITGTDTQINSDLNTLQLTSDINNDPDFILTYYATNDTNAETATKLQTLRSVNTVYLGGVRGVYYYAEDTLTAMQSSIAPLITDDSTDGSGTYTMQISALESAAKFVNATASSTGISSYSGSISFNSGTGVLTITGTRSEINHILENGQMSFQAGADYASIYNVQYAVTTAQSNTQTKYQQAVANIVDEEVSNMTLDRSFFSNRANAIFSSNTPQITDAGATPTTQYTIIFESSIGEFLVEGTYPSGALTTYSFTGTQSQCNAVYSTLRFYPTDDYSGDGTATYKQYKDGTLQLSQQFGLLGAVGGLISETTVFSASQYWTPPYEYVKYGDVRVLLVGGGGGGAGGGGGGGGAVIDTTVPLSAQQYYIQVGTGGVPAVLGYVNSYNFRGGTYDPVNGANGSDTVAFGLTAGGGGGAITKVSTRDDANALFKNLDPTSSYYNTTSWYGNSYVVRLESQGGDSGRTIINGVTTAGNSGGRITSSWQGISNVLAYPYAAPNRNDYWLVGPAGGGANATGYNITTTAYPKDEYNSDMSNHITVGSQRTWNVGGDGTASNIEGSNIYYGGGGGGSRGARIIYGDNEYQEQDPKHGGGAGCADNQIVVDSNYLYGALMNASSGYIQWTRPANYSYVQRFIPGATSSSNRFYASSNVQNVGDARTDAEPGTGGGGGGASKYVSFDATVNRPGYGGDGLVVVKVT